jgi:predicted RNase H-like nuclease
MKWVNPPVAWMLHAGAPRLIQSGVHIPGLAQGDHSRVALEAYPGYAARQIVGRASYKSDDRAKQTPERKAERKRIVATLETGGLAWLPRLALPAGLRRACLDDASGDSLDAVLCALQAAWGWQRRSRNFGLPTQLDPLEGWIVGVAAKPAVAA